MKDQRSKYWRQIEADLKPSEGLKKNQEMLKFLDAVDNRPQKAASKRAKKAKQTGKDKAKAEGVVADTPVETAADETPAMATRREFCRLEIF